ncbi:MAG: DNA polymerase III subunit alpha [Spirochaetales bacterium]|nr:DNA polymerase III subunit alpha [Spirochaetales bacterium]
MHTDCGPVSLRSCFSLLRGLLTPEQLCSFAAVQGWKYIGLADINNFYGLIRFLKSAREHNMRPLAGSVIAIGERELFTAYVLNLTGYQRLCGILSRILVAKTLREYFPEKEMLPPFLSVQGGRAHGPDVLDDLIKNGWEGLYLVSEHPDVLLALAAAGRERLGVGLVYGKPFAALASWGRQQKLPLFALAGGTVRTREERETLRLLRSIDRCVTLDRIDSLEPETTSCFIPSPAEIQTFYNAVPDAIANTQRLYETASTDGIISPVPVFPRFGGHPDAVSFEKLSVLCSRGISRRYGEETPAIRTRLDYELSIIREKGFAAYFLVVNDIVSRCPRTCGRGSAASSIVSYLLGITHVDPLRYNLFFERFLNRGRKDPPDIDVDFPWDEREKALNYVFTHYAGHSGIVADHVTFGPRSSVREPAKAFGLPESEISRIVHFACAGMFDKIPNHILQAARQLRGIPRYIGTHPGGVVITPGPLTQYTHYQVSPLGYPVIAWEKDATEDAGLVKIDLLGNRSLGVLRDTIRLVNRRHRAGIRWHSFSCFDDRETRALVEDGNTVGIFYIESPATRQLLKKMQQADYEKLIIASSIIRPAANRYINEFVERLHGKQWEKLHPLVEETLSETFGIMVYQEDVARVAIAAAGFSASEADMLRKVLSKKAGKEKLALFFRRFYIGARQQGLSDREIKTVWEMVLSFDGYSFCKAHSASYAQVSFRLAYLKKHFPLEFMLSVINNGGGFYSLQTYVNEVRRMGFTLRGPDINKSGFRCSIEAPGVFRLGLGYLCEVRSPWIFQLIEERAQNGAFVSFDDFLHRTRPLYQDLRICIRSGALDTIAGDATRPMLFWIAAQSDRFGCMLFPPHVPSTIGEYSVQTRLRDEVATLGLILSRHPVSVFRPRLHTVAAYFPGIRIIPSCMIESHLNQRIGIAGTLVTGKEVQTKNKKQMMFLSFEDEENIFETVVFPDVYQRIRLFIETGTAFLVVGRVLCEYGAYSLQLEDLCRLTRNTGSLKAGGAAHPQGLQAMHSRG